MEGHFTAIDQIFKERKCGITVPYFITEEALEKLKDFQLYPDDVWVVSYPKSGTTWLQQIVKLIRSNGAQDDTRITHSVPWSEGIVRFPGVDIDALARPRAFKSHFPYEIFPCGNPSTHPCKYIYVSRNLKDVSVSRYAQVKELFFPDLCWDEFWEDFMSWKHGYGDYFDHILGWWHHRCDHNVLFLKYEDLKKDLRSNVAKISTFIGADLTDDVLTKIVDMTTFQSMKENPTTNYKWTSKDRNFIRKGIIGDWKNFLTDQQSAQVDTLCYERFKGTGLDFEFE